MLGNFDAKMPDEKVLKGLTVKRGVLRAKITKLDTKVTNEIDHLDRVEVNLILSKAKLAQEELKELDSEIFDFHILLRPKSSLIIV